MASLLYIEDDDSLKKVNIDDLYEKKKNRDLKQISIFNKILNRIHKRITITGRTKRNEKYIWFTIPEYIFGEPLYDKGDCIGYIVQKLNENGFFIKYIHPNTLFISWENWVPTYVRNEIKKKRGIIINEKGEIVGEVENNEKKGNTIDEINENSLNINSISKNNDPILENKKYNPISNYKPVGNLVYKQELFNKLERKIV
jgi:hypothetical protein